MIKPDHPVEPTDRFPRLHGRIAAAVFFILMALLVASLAAPAIAASASFRTLPELGLDFPAYRVYAARAPEVMGRIAAGLVMQPVFAFTIIATCVIAVLALLSWSVAQIGGAASVRRGSTRFVNVLLVLLLSLSIGSMVIGSSFASKHERYLALAQVGDRARADAAYEEMRAIHSKVETLAQIELAVALAAVGLAAFALLPVRRP